MTPKTKLPCNACRGTGQVKLPPDHEELLAVIRSAQRPVTSARLPRKGITDTGLNQRLRKLERAGLIKRAGKVSKHVLWTAVRKGAA